MFDQKWNVDMIKVQQNQTITLYARWEKAPEEPEETDSFPALAAGALLLAGDDNPFRDVRAIDWFYDDVAFAYNEGLFAGTSNTTFSPNASMTRAMLVTVLYRLDGKPTVSGRSGFSDVQIGSYYEDAVTWAANNGIVNGTSTSTFSPNANVTREHRLRL